MELRTCIFVLFISIFPLVIADSDYLESYYCGDDNCYDLLRVTREATKAEIKRAFRAVALKTHPDKFIDPTEKVAAEINFKKITTAYDILRDNDARTDYDYMLDHPDEFYMNYYRAWRRRNAPNVDVRIVLAVAISLISAVQYYNGWSKFDEAISHFSSTPKYRNHALEIARQDGLLDEISDKKKMRGFTKQQIREKETKIIRKVVEEKMDIRGVYAKPTIYDLLWVQLVMIPVWTAQYIAWYARWVWKFYIKKESYGDEEKLYIIRKNMKMSQGQFDALEEHEHAAFMKEELWIPENFKEWKQEKDEEIRVKAAQSSKMKMYRRYMKNHGPGRMYFDDS